MTSSGLGVSDIELKKEVLINPETGEKNIKIGDLNFPPRKVDENIWLPDELP